LPSIACSGGVSNPCSLKDEVPADTPSPIMTISLRTAVLIVALLNLAYFAVEFTVALNIRSVSLFADSVDFLEDTSVNLLIFFALAWSAKTRARVGMAMALVLLIPALAFLWSLWGKFSNPMPPEPFSLATTGLGGLIINSGCALLLARFRMHSGSLTKAAFLSARNDAIANIAIVAAGLITAYLWQSVWPDILVGLGIAVMNLDAAREVWEAAHEEHQAEV